VGSPAVQAPHFGAELPSGGGDTRRHEPTGVVAGDVRIGLKLSAASGRLASELHSAWRSKPYWGKPTVRNFWEGCWKRDHGSRTEAHGESLGLATGPYRRRVSALPDRGCLIRDSLEGNRASALELGSLSP
jgi:hypothetical protein